MTLPVNHGFKEDYFSAYCPSIGTTPVAAYLRVPFRGRIGTIGVMPQGVITTADCAVAVAVNGTNNTGLAGTLPVASAAAGTGATWEATTPTYVNEGDVIKFTPSGASGATIAAHFTINIIGA